MSRSNIAILVPDQIHRGVRYAEFRRCRSLVMISMLSIVLGGMSAARLVLIIRLNPRSVVGRSSGPAAGDRGFGQRLGKR